MCYKFIVVVDANCVSKNHGACVVWSYHHVQGGGTSFNDMCCDRIPIHNFATADQVIECKRVMREQTACTVNEGKQYRS
jgi:hypothetical protein